MVNAKVSEDRERLSAEDSSFEGDPWVVVVVVPTVTENAFVNSALPQSAALNSLVDCLSEAQTQRTDAAFLRLEYAACYIVKCALN